MQSTKPMQLHNIMSKTTYQMIRMVRGTKVEDTSANMTIDVEDTKEEVDSLGIATTDHVDPSNALHVIRRDISIQTVHIKTELTSNFVLIVE